MMTDEMMTDEIVTNMFFFDGNQAWGHYPKDWERIKEIYAPHDLRGARASMSSLTPSVIRGKTHFMPSFGYRIEHQGPMTLGEWMQLYDLEY